MVNEKLKITGKLEIFNDKTGEKLYEKKNLVVNTGLAMLVDRLKAPTPDVLSHIAVGTGATLVIATDTALETELLRKEIDDIDTVNNSLTAETLYQDYEALGTWKEVGMFNASSGGIMFNRINVNFEKTNEDAVRTKFTITISTS